MLEAELSSSCIGVCLKGALCYMQDLADSVYDMEKGNDWFLVAPDFADYLRAQVCHLWALLPASVRESDGVGVALGGDHLVMCMSRKKESLSGAVCALQAWVGFN